MEFRSAIVDELGYVVYWCSDLYPGQVENILENHPEWKVRCIQIG